MRIWLKTILLDMKIYMRENRLLSEFLRCNEFFMVSIIFLAYGS